MAVLDAGKLQRRLDAGQIRELFNDIGWDRAPAADERVLIDDELVALTPVAQKRAVPVYLHRAATLPDRARRVRIERALWKRQPEHLIVFQATDTGAQVWQWVKREPGRTDRHREQAWLPGQDVEQLRQKLDALIFTLEEEEDPTRVTVNTVTGRMSRAFDADKVTKSFYADFKGHHDALMAFLKALPEELRSWYASVTLNRLMFVYFIQKKGFIDGRPDYLREQLERSRAEFGKDQFFARMLSPLFFRGFACSRDERSPEDRQLLGDVPYLNGGLFQQHQIEREHGEKIALPDTAFASLFDFFDGWRWHLDEREPQGERAPARGEINPDVLGYIFEKYINNKQMGAYYTKEDITEYICANTMLPRLLDKVKERVAVAFRGEGAVWRLLTEDPDRYIWPSVRHGADAPLPATIAVGVDDVAQRGGWDRPATRDLGLPTETWREMIHRRERAAGLRARLAAGEIATPDAMVTANLDIARFVGDAIQSASEDQLRAWWQALQSLTVLDPACGSGAFLFAALKLLEPLYTKVFEAMESVVADAELAAAHGGTPLAKKTHLDFFRGVLAEAARHANPRYFVLRQVTLNNLYGVDIMEEAAEICKLRLFLKLVAQLDDVRQIEPLPDLDFNIRSGNSLVGFASRAQLDAAIGGQFDFESAADRIEEDAEKAALCFRRFKDQQVVASPDPAELRALKGQLRDDLAAVADQADRWLADRYGKGPEKPSVFAAWRKSHKPFHWFTEFYDVMHDGGFDVTVGNPPYVENEKIDYVDASFISLLPTAAGGNLYAPFVERAHQLSGKNDRIGLVVPISLVSVRGFSDTRRILATAHSSVWLSNYSVFPAKLFTGVAQRITIVLAARNAERPQVAVTGYRKWFEAERPQLMQLVEYEHLPNGVVKLSGGSVLPKLVDDVDTAILAKMQQFKPALPLLMGRTHELLYHRSPNNWIRAHTKKPFYRGARGEDVSKDHMRFVGITGRLERDAFVAVLMSSLFFWWYEVWGNCRNLTDVDLNSFPLPRDPILIKDLAAITVELESDMKRNVTRFERNQQRTGKVVYDQFYVGKSKPIIDRIDDTICNALGLTLLEADHIKAYSAKFRSQGDDVEAA